MRNNDQLPTEYNRRDFLKGGSLATVMTLMGGVPLLAQDAQPQAAAGAETKPAGPKVKCAVIGLGTWGREIVDTLQRVPQAELAVICDTYASSLRKAATKTPTAKTTEDYKTILADKDITAVIVATPTHLHKAVVLEALKAKKHVYCEAPLAHTVEDAKAIALAAKDALRQVFQAGLQLRSDPQRHFLMPFIRSGALGEFAAARAQWNKKTSWRATSPNAEREKELNWRLDPELSTGLVGEVGIHQVDELGWFLGGLPKAVSGFGAITAYADDGRQVADTIQAVFEYPKGVNLNYSATLANSFEGDYGILYGSFGAVMIRGNSAWLFKEADAPALGWEVYARKDQFFKETGIALRMDASKQKAILDKPGEEKPSPFTPLYYALENFLGNCTEMATIIEDFDAAYDPNDRAGFAATLAGIKLRPAASWKDGYEATVAVIKANEAITKKQRVVLGKPAFELA